MNGLSQAEVWQRIKDRRTIVCAQWTNAEKWLGDGTYNEQDWEAAYYSLLGARDEMNVMLDDLRRYLKQKTATVPVESATASV